MVEARKPIAEKASSTLMGVCVERLTTVQERHTKGDRETERERDRQACFFSWWEIGKGGGGGGRRNGKNQVSHKKMTSRIPTKAFTH